LLEDPWNEPEESMFQMSTSPENAPDEGEYVEIEFESGNPIAVNGEKLSLQRLWKHSMSSAARMALDALTSLRIASSA
jgi:argininosuccinate synthase